MATGTAILQPTFQGHVSTTTDALVLFEACLNGQLSHVPRRPHDRERNQLIRSGSVFIYEENASGIKRWTDGVTWSPSRILGNFLVYRELDKPFPPGEKKRAMKKNTRRQNRPGEPYPRPESTSGTYSPTTPQTASFNGSERTPTDTERSLIGSLIDSYGFKADGLVKKTMSVTVGGVTHHLVSYYNVNDVIEHRLQAPSQVAALQYIRPRPDLVNKQSFRAPLEELDETVEGARENVQGAYAYRTLGPPQGYIPGGNPYNMQSHYPQVSHQGMPNAYSVGAPTMGGGYVPPQLGPPTPQRDGDYNTYGASQYHRGYAPMSSAAPSDQHRTSLPPTPGSLPPGYHDRQQPPQTYPHMYPQQATQQRSATAPGPSSMDTRAVDYNRHSYSVPNSVAAPNTRAIPPSPMIKYEDPRDGPQQQHGSMYSDNRSSYYGHNAPPQMNQGQYQPPVSASPWQHASAPQPSA